MDNDNSPVRQDDADNRKVNVWTPEDAARFLSSAIQEAQRPLTDALRQRSVSPGIFALVVALLVAAAAICGWILFDRLEKSDQAAETARAVRDQAVVQRHEIQARHDSLASRLKATQEMAESGRRERDAEIERLRTETAGLKGNEEDLRRLRTETRNIRRQYELLKSQMDGLEMEKEALARQLAAVKALTMSEGDGVFGPADELDMPESGFVGSMPGALRAPETTVVETPVSVPESSVPAETQVGPTAPAEILQSEPTELEAARPSSDAISANGPRAVIEDEPPSESVEAAETPTSVEADDDASVSPEIEEDAPADILR
jgi:hypothetical protein